MYFYYFNMKMVHLSFFYSFTNMALRHIFLFYSFILHQCLFNLLNDSVHPCCLGDHISVSGPEGPFSLRPLRDVTHLYLIAAGTGFTPMARLIQLALQDSDTIRWEHPAL